MHSGAYYADMKSDLNETVLEVLSQQKVRNQLGLQKLLKQRGIVVTQSTLSRHLRQLGLQKKEGFYQIIQKSVEGVQIIPVPPNLIVLKTLPGHAQAIAYRLDQSKMEGLVGTVAGDDTLFLAVQSPKFLKSVSQGLMEYLE
jgi:transcriptional regulator of arginine metabolism